MKNFCTTLVRKRIGNESAIYSNMWWSAQRVSRRTLQAAIEIFKSNHGLSDSDPVGVVHHLELDHDAFGDCDCNALHYCENCVTVQK